MVDKVLFSSKSVEWGTPQSFFDKLDIEFTFDLDPCATDENAKCRKYFTKEENGLERSWPIYGSCAFMNPPYGRDIGDWIKKARMSALEGMIVVCLIPARTDTVYWHDHVMKAKEIRFVKGRLNFENLDIEKKGTSATFPSAVVVFDREDHKAPICRSMER